MFIILNGGLRFDQYDLSASSIGLRLSPDLRARGTTISAPSSSRSRSPASTAAYGTASEPVGAELDAISTNYGGLNPTSPVNQIFGPIESKAEEVGTKWELFDKHLLATARPVPHRRQQCPRTDRQFASRATIAAGAAYHVQGVDLGAEGKITDKWSVYTGLVLMKNRVDHSAIPTNIGLPLAFIANQSFNVLTQISGHRRHRCRRPGDLSVANLRRYVAGSEPGHRASDYWRFDAFLGRQGQQELAVEAVRRQHLQQALLRRLLSKRVAVRARRARPRRSASELSARF